ncbi:MAG: ribosome maturation factor RimM, partial [Bacteroidales bacterium]|nr:ribosome maturation factor RimM [Bacteroidales bacterium]
FVDIGGQLIPLIINQIIFRKGNQAMVILDEIETSDGAEGYVGLELYLPLAYLPPLSGNNFYFHEVIGYTVIDKNYGRLGDIQRVLEQTSQPVFVIIHGEKEVLIPVADEIILKVDRKKKEIMVDSPEGLIDIYLSK